MEVKRFLDIYWWGLYNPASPAPGSKSAGAAA
jgi:hypothetical protein